MRVLTKTIHLGRLELAAAYANATNGKVCVCAWCQTDEMKATLAPFAGNVSHGICDECKETVKKERRAA